MVFPLQISQLHAVVEELEILINENFLNRKYDLLTKANQTEEIIEGDEKEDRIEKTEELRKSKIKIQEMENENTKVNFVIKGLCDKVTHFYKGSRDWLPLSLKVVEENLCARSVKDFNQYYHPIYPLPLPASFSYSKKIHSDYKFPQFHNNKILSYIGNKLSSPFSYISSSEFLERKSRRTNPYKRLAKPSLDPSTPFLELVSFSF